MHKHSSASPARGPCQVIGSATTLLMCAFVTRNRRKIFKTTRTVSKSLNRSKQTTAALTLLVARSVSGSELALPLGPRGEPSHRRCGPRLFQHEAPNSCAVRFWKLVLQNDWSQVVPFCKKVAQIFTGGQKHVLDNSKLLSGPLIFFFFVHTSFWADDEPQILSTLLDKKVTVIWRIEQTGLDSYTVRWPPTTFAAGI